MIENLRSAMKELLAKNEWMDAETKTKAQVKVRMPDLKSYLRLFQENPKACSI
jgi:predicted metalloendopeptidase